MTTLEYLEAVLDVCQEADHHDMVIWHGTGASRRASVICNDVFAWACADCEEIRPEDIALLRECLSELEVIERTIPEDRNDSVATAYLPELYAARKRGMRPQAPCYEDKNGYGPRVAALLDAAGPERSDSDGKRKAA